MKFKIIRTNKAEESVYKTLYIKKSLINEIKKVALNSNTSFNNVVISMITFCLSDDAGEQNDEQ
ncbi:MAG: hypothetical protein HFE78_01745 [Clostridiales bacterium]|nr:hypothetical protein [Clostridiales bacterium]